MNKLELAKYFIDENFKNKNYVILDVKGTDESIEISPFPIECSKHLPQRKIKRKLTIEIDYYCLIKNTNGLFVE